MAGVAALIAERALEAYREALRGGALARLAAMALADTLAVAAAAPRLEPWTAEYARRAALGGGGAVIPGLWQSAPPPEAAVANALLSHALELDDWLAPAYIHAGSVVAPIVAALAAGEPLQRALAVVAAGYEAALTAGSYYGRSHYSTWHSTATAGSIAAAVTAAVAAAGPERGVAEAAASLAAVYVGGLWAVNRARAPYKPLSPAHAVATGLQAALAASIHGEPVPGGVEESCRAHGGQCAWNPPAARGLELNGYKFYPSCRHSHTSVEAALRLHNRIDPARVEEVEVRVFREAIAVAGKRDPQTRAEARFSIPLLVAAALHYGRLGLREIDEALRDPRVRRLASRVRLAEDPEYTRAYPRLQPATVRARVGGAWVEETVEAPRGDPARGVKPEDILGKARQLAAEARDPCIAALAQAILEGSVATLGEALPPPNCHAAQRCGLPS